MRQSCLAGANMKLRLTPKQQEAFNILLDKKTRVLVFGGGAGGGKSWLGCAWLIVMCITYPNTNWFIAREELKRLRESTYKTFLKVAVELCVTEYFTFNSQYNFIKFSNGSMIYLLECKGKPGDPMFERFGSTEYTGGFLEEGSEVMYDAMEALLDRIGRQYNDKYDIFAKILVTCNPKKNWIYHMFYKPSLDGSLPVHYSFIQSLVDDNYLIESQYKEILENKQDGVQKERLLYGNWNYEDEPDQLIEFEWLEKCFYSSSRQPSEQIDPNQKYYGVDVAHMGRDKSAIAKIFGASLVSAKEYKMDTLSFGDVVYQEACLDYVNPINIGVDKIGVGAGTYDKLVRDYKFSVHKIESSGSPVYTLSTRSFKFNNIRSQMWWVLREDIKNENLFIDIPIDSKLSEQIISELTCIRYEIKRDKEIKVESKTDVKNRLGANKSPDIGDAIVYANWMRHLRKKRNPVSINYCNFGDSFADQLYG